MSCILTVKFFYQGAVRETQNYPVPDGTYTDPYKVNRPDLGYNGISNKVYSVDCDGFQGILRLGTYYPSGIDVSIFSASNSCALAFDCINAACRPSTEYNTPGIYSSLSECEQACGTGCSGKCINNSDWQKIQELANQLKNKNCN